MLDEWPEASNQFFTWRYIFFQTHPRVRPVAQIATAGGSIGRWCRGSCAVYFESFRLEDFGSEGRLITLLTPRPRHPGLVYQLARFGADKKSLEADLRPREASGAL